MQQYGHWKRQRGIANSKSIEQLYCIYKGKMPRTMPKHRMYVDPGSPLFNQVVRNVPVLAPKHQALVGGDVRDESLASMTGVPHHEDKAERERESRDAFAGLDQPATSVSTDLEQSSLVAAVMKKRKLYKQLTGSEVPWFPHDNDMALLKELCWEAGSPRWVIHGTPAGGAGLQGCLEAACSVVLLCFDEHHRTHLSRFILERAVESMVTGVTLVFKDESLRARSIDLNLTKMSPERKDDAKDNKDKQEAESAQKKKDKKKEKNEKDTQNKKGDAKADTPKKNMPAKRKDDSPAKTRTESVKKKSKKETVADHEESDSGSSDSSSADSSSQRM